LSNNLSRRVNAQHYFLLSRNQVDFFVILLTQAML